MPRMMFLLYPGFELLDFSGPAQVFHDARQLGMDLELLFCGSQESLVSEQGLVVAGLVSLPETRPGDWVFVPGFSPEITVPPASLSASLRRAASHGARIVSTCTGAFILGKAGLLDHSLEAPGPIAESPTLGPGEGALHLRGGWADRDLRRCHLRHRPGPVPRGADFRPRFYPAHRPGIERLHPPGQRPQPEQRVH